MLAIEEYEQLKLPWPQLGYYRGVLDCSAVVLHLTQSTHAAAAGHAHRCTSVLQLAVIIYLNWPLVSIFWSTGTQQHRLQCSSAMLATELECANSIWPVAIVHDRKCYKLTYNVR